MNKPQRHVLPVYAVVPRKKEQMHQQLIKSFNRGGLDYKLHIMKNYLAFTLLEKKMFQSDFDVCTPTCSLCSSLKAIPAASLLEI